MDREVKDPVRSHAPEERRDRVDVCEVRLVPRDVRADLLEPPRIRVPGGRGMPRSPRRPAVAARDWRRRTPWRLVSSARVRRCSGSRRRRDTARRAAGSRRAPPATAPRPRAGSAPAWGPGSCPTGRPRRATCRSSSGARALAPPNAECFAERPERADRVRHHVLGAHDVQAPREPLAPEERVVLVERPAQQVVLERKRDGRFLVSAYADQGFRTTCRTCAGGRSPEDVVRVDNDDRAVPDVHPLAPLRRFLPGVGRRAKNAATLFGARAPGPCHVSP